MQLVQQQRQLHQQVSFKLFTIKQNTFLALIATQAATLCPTAQWNQTFSTVAGIISSAGSSATLLYYPYNIYFDGYYTLYVADTSNHRIQYFPHGKFKAFFMLAFYSGFYIFLGSPTGITVAGTTASAGSTFSQLNNPYAVYVDPNRYMYILDTSNYRVLKWQLGEPLGYVVAGGNGGGGALTQLGTSYAMFVDNQRNIYVSESGNHRVTLWLATNTTSGILVNIYCVRIMKC